MADEVIVIVSKPSAKSERPTNIGTTISYDQVEAIFNIYKKAYGLKNVKIVEAPVNSPIKASYDYAETLKNVDVIFGSSDDPEDLARWKTVEKYMKDHNPSINVIDPKTTTVKRLTSATKIRNQIDNLDAYKEFLPKKLNDKEIKQVYDILNKR